MQVLAHARWSELNQYPLRGDWEDRFSRIIHGTTAPEGGPALVYETGLALFDKIVEHVYIRGDLLDIGCGNGRLLPHVLPLVSSYTGVDVDVDCIDFCRRELATPGYEISFRHLDVRNEMYNPAGSELDVTEPLPAEDSSMDVVFALSLFTHLETFAAAEYYAAEIHRILRPSGQAVVSWFRSPPNRNSSSAERTVYPHIAIREWLKPFMWLAESEGHTTDYHDQWYVYLEKM